MLFIGWGRNFPKSNTTVLSINQHILGNYLWSRTSKPHALLVQIPRQVSHVVLSIIQFLSARIVKPKEVGQKFVLINKRTECEPSQFLCFVRVLKMSNVDWTGFVRVLKVYVNCRLE